MDDEKKNVTVSARMEQALAARFKAWCDESKRDYSIVIRTLLLAFLQMSEAEKDACIKGARLAAVRRLKAQPKGE